MKDYKTSEIRNISLIGNAGSGKTTLAEAMLFQGGIINRRGDIASKSTVSDYRDIEHEHGSSVQSTLLYAEWNGRKLNFIDNPGADDFSGQTIASLSVTDGAVMLINSQNGVEVGTEIMYRHCKRMKKPVMFVANHLDHEKTNFDKTIDELKQYFGSKVVLVQYPVNPGPDFTTIVDVLMMKMYKWGKDGGKPEVSDIPASEKERADELHNILVEAAAENDENLMELFFDKGELNEDELRMGIRTGLLKADMYPVFCAASKKDIGTTRIMDFIGNVFPSPEKAPVATDKDGNEVPCKEDGPTSVYVFKSAIEMHIGEVMYFKVMSGSIEEGADLINMRKGAKERVSQLFATAGKTRTKVTKLVAGDLGSTVKLKETKVHHTLNEKGCDFDFGIIKYPDPKHRMAIHPISEADDEKMGEALSKIHAEDPTLIVEYAKELRQIIVHGQGEYHLNTLKWYMDHIYKIPTEFVAPKISYRETITKPATANYRHKKQSGGSGQFGEVHLVVEPYHDGMPAPGPFKFQGKELIVSVRGTEEETLPWGGKLVFVNCIVGGVIETRFLPGIKKGIMEKMEVGPLTGSYARDIRVCIYDGKMHPVDSNEISFKLAGAKAFSEAFKAAGPKIMEPVYDVVVLTPNDRMGDVMSDLQGRRAVIMSMNSEGGYERLNVRVPLAEMHKYSTSLSSLTSGRATFTMKFAEFVPAPGEVQDKLLKEYEAATVEE